MKTIEPGDVIEVSVFRPPAVRFMGNGYINPSKMEVRGTVMAVNDSGVIARFGIGPDAVFAAHQHDQYTLVEKSAEDFYRLPDYDPTMSEDRAFIHSIILTHPTGELSS